MKLYDKIKELLTQFPELRDSDKKLIWGIWKLEGSVTNFALDRESFMKATSPESIRRARQLVQADFPELQSNKRILNAKKLKESFKGTFAYREEFGDDGEKYDLDKQISENENVYDELKEQGKLFN